MDSRIEPFGRPIHPMLIPILPGLLRVAASLDPIAAARWPRRGEPDLAAGLPVGPEAAGPQLALVGVRTASNLDTPRSPSTQPAAYGVARRAV